MTATVRIADIQLFILSTLVVILVTAGNGDAREELYSDVRRNRITGTEGCLTPKEEDEKTDPVVLGSQKNVIETAAARSLFLDTPIDVKAQISTSALLPCAVANSSHFNVKWVRSSTGEVLTNSTTTLSLDRRYYVGEPKAEWVTGNNFLHWNLEIRLVNPTYTGTYECRVTNSTNQVQSRFVHLTVKVVKAEILGSRRKVLYVGTTLRLSCDLQDDILERPEYIFWYHNDRMINYDLRNGVYIRMGRQGSELVVPRAELSHSGNYSCAPSNAVPANATVNVVEREEEIPPPKSEANRVIAGNTSCIVLYAISQQLVSWITRRNFKIPDLWH